MLIYLSIKLIGDRSNRDYMLVFLFNPLNAYSGQFKQSDNFDEILQAKAKLGKYLKEQCCSEYYQ